MTVLLRVLLAGLAMSLWAGSVLAEDKPDCKYPPQFTFSWPYANACTMKPRGGTTKGTAVTLDDAVHPGWLALQDPAITDIERDRRAILAMVGPYRSSFDFLEAVGYTPQFKPGQPYQSWGTEYVYLVEEREDFISLQHIIVMYFEDEQGEVSAPMVMKHWRQDWQYQKPVLLTYTGRKTWERKALSAAEVQGSWAQAVYQVDDSPRYEAYGRWEHFANFSTWSSSRTWRPLPRREYSVRNDYHVLIGTNRHTVTPTGWVQEEENYKVVLDDAGNPIAELPYLAKEIGLNRYERIIGHDFSAGTQYWRITGPFWADVRASWAAMIGRRQSITLQATVDGQPLFMLLFEYARKIQTAERYDSEAGRRYVDGLLEQYARTPQ